MAESVVNINGNLYRYEYVDGATVYRGPVGDAPALEEAEFLKSKKYPTVMDLATAEAVSDRFNNELNAPYVRSRVDTMTLGWEHPPTIMLTLSLDPRETWPNGIIENSRLMRFSVQDDGTVEQFQKDYHIKTKFRKRRMKNVHDAVEKINEYITKVEVEG